jgi:hypothetical protein
MEVTQVDRNKEKHQKKRKEAHHRQQDAEKSTGLRKIRRCGIGGRGNIGRTLPWFKRGNGRSRRYTLPGFKDGRSDDVIKGSRSSLIQEIDRGR